MTPNLKLLRFLNDHGTAIAAVTGLLAVLIGAVLSIEFHPAFRLV